MAAYYDPYDSRPHSSRRNDSFTRPREDTLNHPAAGHANTSHGRVGEVDDRYSSTRSYRHSDDLPYRYPPPPPPDTGRPGPPPPSPSFRRQHSWPPRPTCEDEVVSLAREAGAAKLLKGLIKDEAQSRGTIDQDPIIQDVPEFIQERRYVLASDSGRGGKSNGIPTPPTSEDERARRLRKPSRLHTNLNDGAPEVSRRTTSPYAFTKPTRLPTNVSSSDRFLSPSTLTPPPADSGRRRNRQSPSKVSSPRRDSARLSPSARRGNDYFSGDDRSSASDNAVADDDGDTDEAIRASRRKPKSKESEDPQPKTSKHTAVKDFAAMSPNAPQIRRMNLDARRNTDTANTMPTMNTLHVNKSRRPSPLMAAGAYSLSDVGESAVFSAPTTPGADPYRPQSRESSYVSSRGISPAASINQPSPPRSARLSSDLSGPNRSAGSNSPTSATGSASASRPASPSLRTPNETPRLPQTDLDWSTLLAANAARKNKPPSRLATSMQRQASVSDMPHVPSHARTYPPPTGTLPYPEDTTYGSPTVFMPSEDAYHPPSHKPSLAVPGVASASKSSSRGNSPTPSNASNLSRTTTSSQTVRPSLPRHHSAMASTSPTEERPRLPQTRKESFSTSAHTRKELASLLKKGLPECRRPEPVAGYDDWYTVIGAPNLSFCPDCVDSVFERTVYRPHIRRLPQLNLRDKIGCALGSSPWTRLAWVFTLHQHRTDLTLLKDLDDIEKTSEPCPGSHEAVRSWYGLRDHEGFFVRDFHICYSDVRKIERLLPTLSGFFVRLPARASYGKYICAIRSEGNRFSTYLDALMRTHDKAMASKKGPDPMPFIDLVERKTRLKDCTRDNMLIGGLWHFIPSVPALTVCEDCYDAIVEPEVRKKNEVAMRFNRTVQPVYGEGMGSSCQLYSRRMRKVFQRAIEDVDHRYLARKANERREAEVRLQERYKDVMRRAKRLSRDSADEDERRLERELERITEEWKERWE